MKTILAVMAFALVAGQSSVPDQVKSFIGHIGGDPQKAPALVVTATPNFGTNPQPGDQVSWVIDVRNPGGAPVSYWALVQITTNLSPPQMSCPSAGGCQNITGPAVSGNVSSASINQLGPGASLEITETAVVQASGPFRVVVRSGPQSVDPQDPATIGDVVATLPGRTRPPSASNTVPSNQVWVPPDGFGAGRQTFDGDWWRALRRWLPWLAVGGGVLVVAVTATAVAVHNARRRWWRSHTTVQADARAGQAAITRGPIANHVAVRLAYGPAGPRGPIPTQRISDG